MRTKWRPLLLFCSLLVFARICNGQSATGTLDITVHITPHGSASRARAADLLVYLDEKATADIVKEVEGTMFCRRARNSSTI